MTIPTKKKRRRYRFRSRAMAESAYEKANRLVDVARTAINDLINGEVQWVERGAWRIGICRPTAPCGGVVIVSSCGYASCYYLERWTWDVTQKFRQCPPRHNDKDMLNLQGLAREVQCIQRTAIEAEIKKEKTA